MDDSQIQAFFKRNSFNDRARALVEKIFEEGRVNHFLVFISAFSIDIRQALAQSIL
jgi:hypothetical protein